MSNPPPAPPSLDVLRKEIDTIDEQVHRLLMARGDIIDRLISVKQTQEVGSAFRPAREADMMRRLAQRHRGILPLDTVESIWRVIISTFTYVQAPFSVHADISPGESAMRDSARFHFGFTVPYVSHFSAPAAVEAVANSKGDLALVSATSSRTPWWIALEADGAPKIIAAAVHRARRPSGGAAGIRGVARRRQRHGHRGRDVERAGIRLERRDRARAVAAGGNRRGAG
jgi:chorismate mutase